MYWDQAVYKKPEKPRRFPWHQDNGYTFIEPQQYLTCWLALTDASEQNGCPWIAPGVHRAGTLAHSYVDPLGFECFAEPPTPAVPAPVGAGSALVFSSLTPHMTGPNLSDEVRKAYILQYTPAGAQVLRGDPNVGAPTQRVACEAPERQFPILRDGLRVPWNATRHVGRSTRNSAPRAPEPSRRLQELPDRPRRLSGKRSRRSFAIASSLRPPAAGATSDSGNGAAAHVVESVASHPRTRIDLGRGDVRGRLRCSDREGASRSGGQWVMRPAWQKVRRVAAHRGGAPTATAARATSTLPADLRPPVRAGRKSSLGP